MRNAKKWLVSTVVAAMFVTVLAGPALADKPVTFTDSVTFADDNPCTDVFDPEEQLVTINLVITVHEHQNNIVAYSERSGTTDTGFTMINGRDSIVDNGNVLHITFMDMWRHPDGSKFQVRGIFLVDLNTGELQVEKNPFQCLGDRQ